MELLLLIAAGYFFYKYESIKPPSPGPVVAQANPPSVQPSNGVPQNIPIGPRVDSANQPWYGGQNTFTNMASDVGTGLTGIENFWSSMSQNNNSGQKDPYHIQAGPSSQPITGG